jgi:ferrous iron transport protein A
MVNAFTLDRADMGQTLRVVEIQGGWGIRQRLNRLGIHPGDKIVVRRSGIMGGPILVQVHGTEVAVGRGMARKVLVTQPDSGENEET